MQECNAVPLKLKLIAALRYSLVERVDDVFNVDKRTLQDFTVMLTRMKR